MNGVKILPITLQKIENENHNALMSSVKDAFESENIVSYGFETLIEALKVALQAESNAMGVRRKSYLTDELVKMNARREELYAGMYYHYQSCLRHYDETMRKAAKGISHIMKSIAYIHNTSNMTRHAYIYKITYNIRLPMYAAMVETMQLTGWLDALDAQNDLYQETWMNRNSEQAKKGNGNGNVRSKRIITDRAYQDIVQRLNALIIIEGPEKYTHLVRLLNVYISDEKKSMAIREGWRKHNKAKKAEAEKASSEAPESGE